MTGYNTDVQGCVFSLKKSGWIPSGPVLLLGAGGAARAVVEALFILQAKTVFVFDPLQDRLSGFIDHFRGLHPEMEILALTRVSPDFKACAGKADLLINASPVGMWPDIGVSPIDPGLLPESATVFDLVPKPIHTLLLQKAKNRGMATVPGIRMLIAQALESDSLFLNRPIPSELADGIERDLYSLLEENVQS
jgi:shikimate dehydrogenase